MQQYGIVSRVLDGNMAEVEIMKHPACSGCGACSHGKSGPKEVVKAFNDAGASVGQTVVIEGEARAILWAAFVVYMVPVLMMLTGFALGPSAARLLGAVGGEGFNALLGVLFLALGFGIVRIYDSRVNKARLAPKITSIL